MKKQLLILITLVQVTFALAQNFPVRVTPQAIPPYPTNLSGYANSGTMNSPLRVQLVLNDVTASSREVRLSVSIEGNGLNASSAPVVIGAPTLILDGGIPLNLTIAELAPYFEQQNLQGISSVQYNNSLPDGSYRFCFEVFDAFNGNRLSSQSCATVFLINNDPPFLNKPDNEAKISEQNPTNIIFQWTPRHINVPNVSYEFSIVEVWDRYMDPQAIFLASPPLYQEITTNTSLLYGPIQPLLLAGKRYAWRVRAFATNNGEEVSVFNNNGNSEVFWFDYQANCQIPTGIQVQDVSMTNATISWVSHPEHLDYTVQYREAGSNRWYSKTTPRDYVTVDEFKPDTIYEYRVVGNCTQNSFGESPIETFRTLSEELAEYANCGIDPDPVDLSNQELLTTLYVNDVFTAGDFPVYVKEVSGSTSFTGEGYISTPWLATVRIPVKFQNIKINTDMKLVDGFVVTTYDPNWGSIIDGDVIIEIITGDDGDTQVITVDMDIDEIQIDENGNIILIGADGTVSDPFDGGNDIIFNGNNNEQWRVDADGTITQGEQAEGGPATPTNTNGISNSGVNEITASGVIVTFNNTNGYYSFDTVPENAGGSIANAYDKVPVTSGGEYYIPYKAIAALPNRPTDFITAEVSFSNDDHTASDIIFKTQEGTKIQANWQSDSTTATLSLQKTFDFAKQQIIATVKPKDSTAKYTVAGATNLWHLANQEVTGINVQLISVNGASLSGIGDRINEIYNPAGVRFNVTSATPITVTDTELDVGDSSLLSQYTEGEKAWISQFKALPGYKRDTYYLFVTDIPPSDSDTEGFMPLKRQFGFVFAGDDRGRTAAHELGHGVFGLEHPFTEYNTTGTTNLLMDYGTGIQLSHMDWEKMHAPGIQIYWFQGDEDGEFNATEYLTGNAVVPGTFNQYASVNTNNSISFISPAGKVFSIPINAQDVTFHRNGYLFAFTVEENGKLERYVAARGRKNGQEVFMGYLKSLGKSDTWTQRAFQDDFSRYLSDKVIVHLGKLKRTSETCGIDLYKKQNYTNTVDKDSWNSGGREESLIKESLVGGLDPYEKNITSPDACDLCPDGNKFFNDFSYLVKDEEDREALFGISKMVCSTGEDKIDYNILVAQLNKDFQEELSGIFWGSKKAFFIKAREKFWEQNNALALYLKAIQKVNTNISSYQEKLNTTATKEDFYAALYYLNNEFINSLSYDEIYDLLEFIFKNNVFISEGFFSIVNDDVSLIEKLLNSLNNDELSQLITSVLTDQDIFNDEIDKEKQRYFMFEIINATTKESLSSIDLTLKLMVLEMLLEESLSNMFGNNEDAIVTKVVSSVKGEEAQDFFIELESSENYNIDGKPLLYNLKTKLSDFLNDDSSYTKFFLELNRLSNAINKSSNGELDIKTAITWDVKQRDFALVAFVENRNDYKFQYNNNTHKVSIKRCVEFEYTYDARTDNIQKTCKQEEYLLPEGSSPFDLVGVLILNDVSPLASDCRDGIGKNELCGQLLVVPAIFIDYLNENVNTRRWKNLGWNVFNVTITVVTFGEGALAIKAIQGAAAGTRASVTFQKSYQLLDFAYTAANLGFGVTQTGPSECQNLSDPDEIKKCEEKWKEWNYIGLALTAKSGLDLTENIIKAAVKLKNLSKEEIKEFIEAIRLKKYKKAVSEDEVGKTLDELEDLIYKNDDLKRKYESLLAASNTDIPSFKTKFLEKLNGYSDNLTGLKNWVSQLDEASASLLQKLDNLGDDIVKFGNDFDFNNTSSVSKFIDDPYLVDAWKVLKEFPTIRVKEGNIEVLSRVSGRFQYNNKNSFEGLDDLFNGSSASKQRLIDGLAEVDRIFADKSLPVRFSGIKKGEVKVNTIDGKGEEIARYIDEEIKLVKKKFLETGTAKGEYEGTDILQNGNEVGFKKLTNEVDDTWKYFDPVGSTGNSYSGKDLEIKYTEGSMAEFEKGVKYLNESQRLEYEVFVQYDRIVDSNGNLVNTKGSVEIRNDGLSYDTDKAIFVMSENGKIYISKNRAYGEFHHSSFLSGEKISAAGEITIENGIIKIISNESGHYKPSLTMVKSNMLKELNDRSYFSVGDNSEETIQFISGF
ncbi:fibronectin type III domain-containing protein [Aquimarina sp. SS2-1]|uniref:fibronectin type III domain-containing protein n=1 Tax=Aquimarina besae TaxID=3342247 RepID=UPI00366B988D